MSSQNNTGIPLSHAPDGVGYRLLELPPELLSLLESDDPLTLTLESSPTVGLLRTPGKTYSLRQKNTSNALMLLSVAEEAPPASSGGELAEISQVGVHVIATMHETVELVPEAAGGDSAAPAAPARGKWHERFGRGR
ncbi:hypothetical protein NKR23_g9877 [Pleurostoma richardsiae]|uniref:Sister chromatid cohesion protein DCC1 n=1 Tax=Pleurostoma richardsiae TaxID=41990 RepID=A0AA38VJ39_9PEZI|nr:hypothetical protein NKR23_g9877 [Pleurostoma richardsiae]